MECRIESCRNWGSFGVAGTKTVAYCAQHALDGMVDVFSRKCRTEGCGKRPSFGVTGAKTAEYYLCTTRPVRDDQRLQYEVQNRKLR